jgi:hypothetical protein
VISVVNGLCYSLNHMVVYTSTKQSSPVNCCWPSPAQSFLLSSSFGTHDLIYVRSETVYVFVNGVSSSTRGEVCLSEEAPQTRGEVCLSEEAPHLFHPSAPVLTQRASRSNYKRGSEAREFGGTALGRSWQLGNKTTTSSSHILPARYSQS